MMEMGMEESDDSDDSDDSDVEDVVLPTTFF